MGEAAIVSAVERAGIDPARNDDVFWGVGNQSGTSGGNAGRMALFDREDNHTGSETVTVTQDDGIRPGTTVDALAGLKTVWSGGQFTGPGSSIAAGNASQLSDGAAAQMLMERGIAEAEGRTILCIDRGFQAAGCGPEEMGIGPVFAIPKLLERAHGCSATP